MNRTINKSGARLAFTAGAVIAAGLLLSTAVQAARVEESRSQTFRLDAEGTFIISNVNGSVEIDTWDENKVVLDYIKAVTCDDEEQAREWLERVQVVFPDATPQRLRVETILPETSGWNFFSYLFSKRPNAQVQYRVRLPRRASMEVESVNGTLIIRAPGGSVNADTVNGSVEVSGGTNSVQASTVNGRVMVQLGLLEDLAPDTTWLLKLSSMNGSVVARIPSGTGFDLSASTLNGVIKSDFPVSIEGGIVGKSAEAPVDGGGRQVLLETMNGSIHILRLE